MKVYLAAQYKRKPELQQYREELQALGVEVTSRWLNEKEAPNIKMSDVGDAFKLMVAIQDVEDIDASDAVVSFTEEPDSLTPRGGRHVEFGYALAKGKKLYLCGPIENIFHHLPEVTVLEDFEKVKVALLKDGYKNKQRPKPTYSLQHGGTFAGVPYYYSTVNNPTGQ